MLEDEFVEIALAAGREVVHPPLLMDRGRSLLYQVTVDNRLQLTVKPDDPKRGRSAFQTDLAVFEKFDNDIEIPRVVLEFKQRLTTHDVLTYAAKARKHKQVYPYLRYGLVIANLRALPGRFFTHNEGLDFAVAAASYGHRGLHSLLERLLKKEVEASRKLESITFGKIDAHWFRTDVVIEQGGGGVR
jgi:hypothetical protein